MSRLRITGDGQLQCGAQRFACALGRNGIIAAVHKYEGDGATPAGIYPLRAVYYRADRLAKPATDLPIYAIQPNAGWCDAPEDPAYNQPVKLPFAASHEAMWRADHAYDIVVVIGYNDDPVVPGKGSCIFLHLNHDDGRPTAGCVGLNLLDMVSVLAECDTASVIEIAEPSVSL